MIKQNAWRIAKRIIFLSVRNYFFEILNRRKPDSAIKTASRCQPARAATATRKPRPINQNAFAARMRNGISRISPESQHAPVAIQQFMAIKFATWLNEQPTQRHSAKLAMNARTAAISPASTQPNNQNPSIVYHTNVTAVS